jgi:LacI family transcriptional regulator
MVIAREPEAGTIHAARRPSRPPQLRDVAGVAGVSLSVASRALNRDPGLRARPETVERILAAARELHYRPNAAGRSLRTRAVGAIGVVLPDVNNPFFSDLLTGVEQACDACEIVPLIGRAERLNDNPQLLRNLLGEGRVDGFVIQTTDVFPAPLLDALAADETPCVFLVSAPAGGRSSVVFDDSAGIGVATRHLLELGHRRIGFVGGLGGHGTAAARRTAFEQTLADSGLAVDPNWVTERGFAFENGRQAVDDILRSGSRPTALVVATHNAALGVLHELRLRGIDVPGEFSVVSLHDSLAAEHAWPALTAVRMPLRELGARSVELLVELLDGGEPRHETVREPPPRLVLRQSTRPLDRSTQ